PTADYIEPTTGMEFVFIKGGTFQMGDASDGQPRETPVHSVTLKDFATGMYEVTFDQYDKFCKATGREKSSDLNWGRGNRPAIYVSWEDAQAFAEWMSTETGLNFSLPSESQWEYFARAGTTSRYWTGGSLEKNKANCRECGSKWDNRMTAPVGSFRPNQWGLYDTAGNVAEWTLDDWHQGYEGAPTDGSAWLGSGADEKIYRGGSWEYSIKELSSATRDWSSKSSRFNMVGFRLILNDFVLQKKNK
ncbi:MAG: SUMF1/EgtB/PvdO family nonheme iron enzyme, partial [Desulfuromonadales bacterium]|nr:SUMF1/EgtB/PvdO family nonheme iron enzyme [Desulfuromonadales bacterium]